MSQFTLYEMLMQDTRDAIIANAKMLGININKSHRKAVIARRVSEVILAMPTHILKQLPFREVLKLQQMVHAKDHAVTQKLSFLMDCIEQIGLIDARYSDSSVVEFIYPDLADALLPVIDHFVEKAKSNETKYRREQMILGLLNLYGILGYDELEKLAINHDPNLSTLGLKHVISDSYLLKSRSVTIDRKWYFISPYMSEPQDVYDEISSRSKIGLAIFTREQVMEAGVWGSPQPPVNSATSSFCSLLGKMVSTEEEVDDLVSEYWMLLNNDHDPFSIINRMLDNQFDSMEAVNDLISQYNDWVNKVPRWILKGNSSNHVFETMERPNLQKYPPQMIVGPNARKAGLSISQEELNKIWEEESQPQREKIGRNTPCFCGSGKKYKHCCLRSN